MADNVSMRQPVSIGGDRHARARKLLAVRLYQHKSQDHSADHQAVAESERHKLACGVHRDVRLGRHEG